eukprot:SAG31_NODE_15_length_37942_cov_32.078297_23_plen_84_part_00
MARKAGYCITTLLLSNGPAALHLAVHCMIAAAALAIQVKYSPVMDQETNRHESISLYATARQQCQILSSRHNFASLFPGGPSY